MVSEIIVDILLESGQEVRLFGRFRPVLPRRRVPESSFHMPHVRSKNLLAYCPEFVLLPPVLVAAQRGYQPNYVFSGFLLV